MVTNNNIKGFLVSVPNPEKNGSYIDIYLTPIRNTSINSKLVNGSPYINLEYSFTGRIYSIDKNSQYLNPDLLNKISISCNSYLESVFSDYLYKTSKVFNADINGIGKHIRMNFLTEQEFQSSNWNEKYKDSFFDVKVNTIVKSSSLLSET